MELKLRIFLLSHDPTPSVDIWNEKLEVYKPSTVFPRSLSYGRCVLSYRRFLACSSPHVHCRYSPLRGDAVLRDQATSWAVRRNIIYRYLRRFPGCHIRFPYTPKLIYFSSWASDGRCSLGPSDESERFSDSCTEHKLLSALSLFFCIRRDTEVDFVVESIAFLGKYELFVLPDPWAHFKGPCSGPVSPNSAVIGPFSNPLLVGSVARSSFDVGHVNGFIWVSGEADLV